MSCSSLHQAAGPEDEKARSPNLVRDQFVSRIVDSAVN